MSRKAPPELSQDFGAVYLVGGGGLLADFRTN